MSYRLKIKQVKYPAVDAVSLYFDKVNGFVDYLPGQHLALTATVNGQKITRNYSFNTFPYLDKEIAITIRSVPGGKMSAYLMRYAHEGMELEAEAGLPTEFYLCGPFGYMTLIEEAHASLNIPNDKILRERFVIPQPFEADNIDFSSLPECKVIIDWQGSKYYVLVPMGKSILEAAFKVGLSLPHSCKEVQCGTCRSLLLSGEVKMKRNHILNKMNWFRVRYYCARDKL